VRLGGANRYGERWVDKPLLASDQAAVSEPAVRQILQLTLRLELVWLLPALVISAAQR